MNKPRWVRISDGEVRRMRGITIEWFVMKMSLLSDRPAVWQAWECYDPTRRRPARAVKFATKRDAKLWVQTMEQALGNG